MKKIDPEKVRKKDSVPIADAVTEMLNSYKIRQKFDEATLLSSWETIMGKTIASRTSTIYIANRKLFLKLTSAPLKKELSMSKSKILDLLNPDKKNPVVEDIVFL
jgi:hypothetical protein